MSIDPRFRSLFLRAIYPKWHKDEMAQQPPAFGVDLAKEMNHLDASFGFVCELCGRAYADRCSYVMSASTAAGVICFCRCTTCAAEQNYRLNRGAK